MPESYRILMYDEERYPSTLYIRVPLGIGPELCRFLHVDFAENEFSEVGLPFYGVLGSSPPEVAT